jgi:hypothetical protein
MANVSQNEEMKRYLFHEMTDEEYDAVEERFFDDSDYFYDLTELENDLVDRYVRGTLEGADLTRFEQSLERSHDWREKVANARAIRTLIAEEKPKFEVVPVPGLWERISNLFNIKTLRVATAAMGILLVGFTGLLIFQNRRLRQEFARVEDERIREIAEKENALKDRISELNQIKLEAQDQQGENADLNERLRKLEEELKDLREQKNIPGNNRGPERSLLAFSISPTGRGGPGRVPAVRTITTRGGKQSALVTVFLPEDKDYETYEITIPGLPNKPGVIPPGKKSFGFTMPARDLDFTVTVTERGRGGSDVLGTYRLNVKKGP